jgi:hypothetical protein
MAYTVTAVSDNVRQWTAKQGGPMNSYRVNLKDAQGVETQNVEWARKVTSDPPTVGETVEGNIDNTDYGLKLKPAFSPGGGGGGGPRGKSPQESAAIQRMHLQKTAPQWIELFLTIGVIEQPTSKEAAVKLGEGIMDWLSKDVEKAKAKA